MADADRIDDIKSLMKATTKAQAVLQKEAETFVAPTHSFYSYLLISKVNRTKLIAGIAVVGTIATLFVNKQTLAGHTWSEFGIFVGAISSLVLLLPMTEEWQYHPWQSRPHRYEKIMFD